MHQDTNEKIMYLKDAASYLGKAKSTLQEWDRNGKLKARRTSTNRRYYYQSDLDKYLHNNKRKSVIYIRIQSPDYEAEFRHSKKIMLNFLKSKNIIPDSIIRDVGDFYNYKRPKFLNLMKQVDQNQIQTIYITNKRNFFPVGFDLINELCRWHKCKIVALINK